MRKLCFGTAGYAGALVIAHYLLPESCWIPTALFCAAAALSSLLLKGRLRQILMVVFLSAVVGFLWIRAYSALYVMPAEACVGSERILKIRIAEYVNVHDDYSSVEAVCISDDLPGGRILIYDYDAGMAELCPGDLIEMPLKMRSALYRYQTEDDYYLASGIRYRGTLCGAYTVTGRARLAWIYFPQRLARELKTAALSAFPSDAAPLMKALLTGDKKEFYENDALYCAFRISGFSHIIAVSGMHVGFLVSLLSLLCGHRRRIAFLGIPLILVFLAMVGFTPSAVRAGIMQILLLIAPLLRRENDSPTSLAAALLLLLLLNPLAVGSISLQLSFAAVAGLLLVTPRIFRWFIFDENGHARTKKGLRGKLLRSIFGTFAASVGAMVFTVPLSALWFGSVPLYGVLTNLLCLWAMSAAFLSGYIVCVLWMVFPPIGLIAGRIIAWLPRYSCFVVRIIAGLPFSEIILRNHLGAWWLAYVYVLFSATYFLKGDRRYRPVIPICGCIISLSAVLLLMQKPLEERIELTAVDVGQGLSVCVLTEDASVVIDCGSTGSAENAGDAASDYLLSSGRRNVDLLVLTHFHADHANGVRRLMNRVHVECVAIPADCETNEFSEMLLSDCERLGTKMLCIRENTDITLGDLALTIYAPLGSEDANEHCLMIRGTCGSFDFLTTGDAGSSVEKQLADTQELGELELLVVGHHGSRYSTCDRLLDEIQPEYAFISVGAGNGYGHPAQATLDRLSERNVEVYRTDLNGTISMTAGYKNG